MVLETSHGKNFEEDICCSSDLPINMLLSMSQDACDNQSKSLENGESNAMKYSKQANKEMMQ